MLTDVTRDQCSYFLLGGIVYVCVQDVLVIYRLHTSYTAL